MATTETPETKHDDKPNVESSKKAETEKPSDESVMKKALDYLNGGKRNLLVGDYGASAASLEESCRILGQHFGETAKECGESYFYYGKALLELARLEAGVIDNAFTGVNEDSDAENNDDSMVEDPKKVDEKEAKEISEKVDDALIENCQETEKLLAEKEKEKEKEKEENPENKENEEPPVNNAEVKAESEDKGKDKDSDDTKKDIVENGKKDDTESEESEEKSEEDEEDDAEKEKETDEEKKETESIASNDAGTSEVKETEDKDAVEKEEEDDPSNLQLSWEMLELAKGIFTKHADSIQDPANEKRVELENRLSETYQLLGEVSIENENYEQAIEDLNSCLRRRQELLAPDSRSIAETHYQLGVAKGFNLEFDDAISSLEASIDVLESRVRNLKEKTESQDPSKKDDESYSREKEIEEITKLIPEIKEKINDTRDMQEETMKKISEQTGFGSSSSAKDDDKPVNDIKSTSSIMVKKRKKSVESGSGDAQPEGVSAAKKPHLETNGTSNGNGEKMEA